MSRAALPGRRGSTQRKPEAPGDLPSPGAACAERERIRAALIAEVAEGGYPGIELGAVLSRAGVEPAALRRHFSDLQRCCLEVWEESAGELLRAGSAAYRAAGGWREGLRALLWSYCGFLLADRGRARFLVELSLGCEPVGAPRDRVLRSYVEVLHRGRLERPQATAVPRARAESATDSLRERVTRSVLTDRLDDLPRFVPGLVYLSVLPYLGQAAAEEELHVPGPPGFVPK